MNVSATVLIVAVATSATNLAGYPDSLVLFDCGFEQATDRDFDHWPDGWTRERGRGYPHYLSIKTSREPSPEGAQCLRIDLDGGAAAAYSPPIEIDPRYDFLLEGRLKTERLRHDRAFLSVAFLDAGRRPAAGGQIHFSKRWRATGGWSRASVGPLSCTDPKARYAVLGVHLEPTSQADLAGAALFDDLWFWRVPRMTVQVADFRPLYAADQPITIECRLSGHGTADPSLHLEIDDALGRSVAQAELPLVEIDSSAATAGPRPMADEKRPQGVGLLAASSRTRVDRFRTAVATWQSPLDRPGFYRLRAHMPGAGSRSYRRELSLAVVEPLPFAEHSEFGWSLPDAEGPLSLAALPPLLVEAGVGWLKFPLWYDERNRQRVNEITSFLDRLGRERVNVVGLLIEPPPETRRSLAQTGSMAAANLFLQDANVWYPSLEPVMAHMALKVRWWQLGSDEDTSFAGLREPAAALAEIKASLDRLGQEVAVGVAWGWMDPVPSLAQPPWRFLSRPTPPTLSVDELAGQLSGQQDPQFSSWVSLQLLDRQQSTIEARATDLVRRIVAAKEQGAERIFLSLPSDAAGSLMHKDGSAGELFLPWRTACRLLSEATYAGRLNLPGGSQNRVFVRGPDTVIAVWADSANQEFLNLGQEVRQIDIWGRSITPPRNERGQVIEVGPTPTFVTQLDEGLRRWQLMLELDRGQLPGVLGVPHPVALRVENPWSQAASGTVQMIAPEAWKLSPDAFDVRLAPGERASHTFEITLPLVAGFGKHMLRFDFDLIADRRYQFSVYRPMELGLGDLFMKIATRLNAAGELEVEQRLFNLTDRQMSFRCYLHAPDRRRMRKQVLRLSQGEDVQIYRLPDGAELVGRTLTLRAEEAGGQRSVLNYTFVADP